MTNLYRRSILIEILRKNPNGTTGEVLESFALTIPPENIKIRQKQRKTETPTPGGLFIDDYGLGTADISISGTTSNQEAKLTILGPQKRPQSLTGKEAYFELRDRIIRKTSIRDENYTMYFYDLTHKGGNDIFFNNLQSERFIEAWEVSLKDFDLSRGSDKPFFYPISIDFTGIRPLGTFNPSGFQRFVGFIEDIKNAIDQINDYIEFFRDSVDAFVNANLNFLEDVVGIYSGLVDFQGQITDFTGQLLEYEKRIGGLFEDIENETSEFINNGVQIAEFPYNVLSIAQETVRDVQTGFEQLVQTSEEQGYTEKPFSWSDTDSYINDMQSNFNTLKSEYDKTLKLSKQTSSIDAIGAVSINGNNTPFYGFEKITVKDNMSLERLAVDLYGDPDAKTIISAINGIYSDIDLSTVETLNVPILQPSSRLFSNAVYNIPSEREDVLGRDIMVDSEGRFVIEESGDYSVTNGIDTVSQAIYFKLSEQKGRQLRSPDYGILTSIGQALNNNAPIEYIGISLKETLVQDPRIIDVYNLNVSGNADRVTQTFAFRVADGRVGEYREGL